MKPIKLLSVASEVYPIIKTGGLADVAGALPLALVPEGVATCTLLPGYPDVLGKLEHIETVRDWPEFYGGAGRLLAGSCAGLDLFVIDAPHLYGRAGNPYAAPNGFDWPDNAIRFAALSRIAADIGQGEIKAFVPDVVHAHDWQAGLTHAYLQYGSLRRPGRVMTVHNLAYQGQFPRELLGTIGLPQHAFTMDGVEYYGSIGYLKAGLRFADRITTVSPTYAVEIQSPEAGMGLDGLLRGRRDLLSGILNGIDVAVWNPATDPLIAARFDAERLADRAANKAALQARFGLPAVPDAFLIGVISRLSWQKGLDLLLETLPTVLRDDVQMVLLGSGDADLQNGYRQAAQYRQGRIGVVIGYDENLAHLIQAGSDALVVPSRFEPCGLTQLCALRYGAIPVVARVGGLADSVVDAEAGDGATGVQFAPVTAERLAGALQRAHALYQDKARWRTLQGNGMAVDVSWRQSARQYAELYRQIA
jgi:starch synthase